MAKEYCVETCKSLADEFKQTRLKRPARITRYEAGTDLVYEIRAVEVEEKARVWLRIEKFVGGGFAGQVYKVRLTSIETDGDTLPGLEVGGTYAMKILIPPSNGSKIFRDSVYWLGYQGPFQLQVNPAAARASAIWLIIIRKAAGIRLGSAEKIVDTYATFIDHTLGSCGQLNQWVEGRTWRLEVDENMDTLSQWRKGRKVNPDRLGSLEYRTKKKFMAEVVALFHEVGTPEFARQYEWSTCKSQPNCLKLASTEDDPEAGLIAVDFSPGLALLCYLPMSPGDVILIGKGLKRGRLVQFDRPDMDKLQRFIDSNAEAFADCEGMIAELKSSEEIYRNSLPDITGNHVRLLYSGKLWGTIFSSAVTGWRTRNLIDAEYEEKFRKSRLSTFVFWILGLVPILGRVLRKCWARADWREHYASIFKSFEYFKRALRGRVIEKAIDWHRKGRISAATAEKFAEQPWRYVCHLPFLLLIFPGVHRFLTDWKFAKEKLAFICVRPIKLYFSSRLREEWMRDMVAEGRKKHIITDEDAETILSQLKEPYVQRYLVSVVVHLLTLPLTQIVSVIVAWIYYRRTGDEMGAGGILILFQVIPISPGSIARGLYAVGIAIYDRSFKNYNIAVFLSFFKYIGYLAFPIQMAYHYPTLSRFMSAHWATDAVHIVPVFGERGALLEHWVFCVFYNWPLTIRRRIGRRLELREGLTSRYWHVLPAVIVGAAILVMADGLYNKHLHFMPGFRDIWWLYLMVALSLGLFITLFGAGAALSKRFLSAVFAGAAMGAIYSVSSALVFSGENLIRGCFMRMFFFAIVSVIGAIVMELKLPEADLT